MIYEYNDKLKKLYDEKVGFELQELLEIRLELTIRPLDTDTWFTLRSNDTPVASWAVGELTGSYCLYSHSSYIDPKYRGVGLGTRLNALRCKAARELGVTLVCTVNDTNEPQLAVLVKNGWKNVSRAGKSSWMFVYN